jgi:magnesium chelatase family protein
MWEGNEARVVTVEINISRGLPSFSIVGLPSNSIQESKERVKAALSSIDFAFPPMRIVINLSPAEMKKSGSHFDLVIALLIALWKEKIQEDIFVFGEIGLDGKVKDASRIFPLILSLAKRGIQKKFLIPKEAENKISKIPNIEFAGVNHIKEAIDFFKNSNKKFNFSKASIEGKQICVKNKNYYFLEKYPLDFKEVKGQERAKRAALIAATGMHNILFEGSPGCGKSMIAKRLKYILPPMDLDEILESAKLDSLEEKEPKFLPVRNFRSPHHSATLASVFGGGSAVAKPGEVALANKGILFFDELPYFQKVVLEALREPLEEKKVSISRVNSKVTYESDIMFVAAMNPCPCGNLYNLKKECRCIESEIKKYKNRISEPLWDRIDLYVQMDENKEDFSSSASSAQMHKMVLRAFEFQKKRNQKKLNGKLNEEEIEEFCVLTKDAFEILQKAIFNFALSQRSIQKIKKVARSIADISQNEKIGKKELLEALGYRRRQENV